MGLDSPARDIKPRTAPPRLFPPANVQLTLSQTPSTLPPTNLSSSCLAAELLVALAPIAAALRVPATAENVSLSHGDDQEREAG